MKQCIKVLSIGVFEGETSRRLCSPKIKPATKGKAGAEGGEAMAQWVQS